MSVTRIKDDFVMVDKEFMEIAIESMERVQELEKRNKVLRNDLTAIKTLRKKGVKQNKRYRRVIESMKSEINYALHSRKSEDVKRFYLENAVRIADEILEGEE